MKCQQIIKLFFLLSMLFTLSACNLDELVNSEVEEQVEDQLVDEPGDDKPTIHTEGCDEIAHESLDENFRRLLGTHTLAIASTRHNEFPMGEDRTEYEFTLCGNAKIIIADMEGNELKTIFYIPVESPLVFEDRASIKLENFTDEYPFQEKFELTQHSFSTNLITADYRTYLEGQSSWSNSPDIRGSAIPQELMDMEGEYVLFYRDKPYTIGITNGQVKVVDASENVFAAYEWDDEFDTVDTAIIESGEVSISLYDTAQLTSSALEINYDLNNAAIMRLQIIKNNNLKLEFNP